MSSVRGLHWGNVELEEKNLEFQVNERGANKNLFKIPFKKINNCTVNKNIVVVEVNTDEANNDEDMLCEVRLFIETGKTQTVKADKPAEGEQAEPKEINNFAETLNRQIIEKAKIGESAGQSIVTLNQISLVVPRGKYTIDFYQKNLRFHGPTFNYNIDYKNIQRGFILPLSNQSQTAIVLQLNKPIHQGQTIHPFVVVQVKKDAEVSLKTKVKPEYIKESPHLEHIKAEYSGQLEEILAELLRSIVQIDLIVPGGHFKSTQGGPYVKCSLKTQNGWLYFLKKSMIFITKPVIYFRVPDIQKVEFHRLGLGGHNKLFDMKIILKGGHTSQFVGIERSQYDVITDYFKQREVPFVKVGDDDMKRKKIESDDEDDSEEDEDFNADGQSGGEDDDDESESLSKDK